MGKRKVVDTTGCTAFALEIDGNSINDLPKSEQEEILQSIINSLKEENGVTYLISNLVTSFGEYESDPNICEQCRDSVSWHTLEID